MTIVNKMRDAIEKMGAPADLVQTMAQPSIGKTEELMRQCDRILATGGPGMVTAAYSSGTPALGVGAGNAVITVDDTADLVDTAEKIRISKTLDLAASCSADNSVIVLESVYDELLSNLIAEGGYVASPEEADKVAAVLWHDGALNTAAVVKQPQVLAEMSVSAFQKTESSLSSPTKVSVANTPSRAKSSRLSWPTTRLRTSTKQ